MNHLILSSMPMIRPCYLNTLPPETISEILLFTSDGFGDDFHLKWRFPLVSRCVSRRFFDITKNTRALWRYIYIREPVYEYMHSYIAHSSALSLLADVEYKGKAYAGAGADEEGGWRGMVDALVPTFSRLSSLVFHSPDDNAPILALLQYDMPRLESLDVEGDLWEGKIPAYKLRSSQFPALRSLRSTRFFHWHEGVSLPPTVEVLAIHMDFADTESPPVHIWMFFPSNLRILDIGHLLWSLEEVPPGAKLQLPRLTYVRFEGCCGPDELSILHYMDAPCLQTLIIGVDDNMMIELPGMDTVSWSLDFPALTRFEWKSQFHLPQLDIFLRNCGALLSAHIKTSTAEASDIEGFVRDLTSNPRLLPLLENLTIFGSSIFVIKDVVQARPRLRRLAVHRNDLTLNPRNQARSGEEWEGCVAWLDSHVKLVRCGQLYRN